MSEDIVDLSEGIFAEEMPCCPICANAIIDEEPACLIFAHQTKALAHSICVMDMREELGI